MLPLLVSIGFQILFHSPPGVLFTFPSRYLFTIGHQGVFSLRRWSSLVHTGFLVSCATRFNLISKHFRLRGYHLVLLLFPEYSSNVYISLWLGWALSCSLAATGDIECFFLFLGVIRCFSSPGIPSSYYFIHMKILIAEWVAPFGDLRFNVCLQLPVAFRSLPRPSSALGAKAFTLCS